MAKLQQALKPFEGQFHLPSPAIDGQNGCQGKAFSVKGCKNDDEFIDKIGFFTRGEPMLGSAAVAFLRHYNLFFAFTDCTNPPEDQFIVSGLNGAIPSWLVRKRDGLKLLMSSKDLPSDETTKAGMMQPHTNVSAATRDARDAIRCSNRDPRSGDHLLREI